MSSLIKPEFLSSEQMDRLAITLRQEVEWATIPVDPFAIASRLGVDVLLGSFEEDNVEGVLRTREGRPQILIRKASPITRQKFTVAHELGHYRLHWLADDGPREDEENFVDDDMRLFRRGPESTDSVTKEERDREIQANMFASALLMPKAEVINHAATIKSVRHLARTFGVSEVAMRFRIGELDVW